MPTRMLLLIPVAALLAAAACRDEVPVAPKRSGPSPPALSPAALALFNDPLTLQLASQLRVTLPTQGGPGQSAADWSQLRSAGPSRAVTSGADSADVVVESAALQLIFDVASSTPPADSGVGP